jgi:hypothetical protein
MKTKFFGVVLLMVIFSIDATAQDSHAGIRGSLNLSNWYTGDDVNDENLKVGFAIGGFYRSYLTENLSLQPGLEFSQKGSTFTYNNIFGDGEIRGILNYIELPVLLNFHLTETLHVGAGPYAALLIGAKQKTVDDDGSTQDVEEYDRDDFTTLDYGLSFDGGIDLEGISAGLRYNLGMNDVIWENSFEDTNLGKNSVLQVYLQLNF